MGAVVGDVVGYSVGTPVGAEAVGLDVVGAKLGCEVPDVGVRVLGLTDGATVGLAVLGSSDGC